MKIKGVIEDLKLTIFFYLKNDNSKNISRTFSGVVVDSVGSVHFQIVPWSGLYFSRSIGPFLRSVQFSRSVVSDSLRLHELQHTRPPCPSTTPGVHSDLCPLSRWCHPAISSSVVPSSSRLQFFPASGSFQMSQLSFRSDILILDITLIVQHGIYV